MTQKTNLSSIHIQNFKALCDSGRVTLSPLTIFIGNNGSGKSSLIEALETYQAIVSDGLETAMQRWLGFKYVWNRRARHNRESVGTEYETYENPMSFSLKGKFRGGDFLARLIVTADPGENGMRIEREKIALPKGRIYRRDREGKVQMAFGKEAIENRSRHVFESAAPADLRADMRKWQFLSMQPEPMGQPALVKLSRGAMKLNRDGSNLGEYLQIIRERDPLAFNGIVDTVRSVLPYLRDVQPELVDAIQRTVYLQMTEEKFKVPGWLLSTGTARILGLLAVLRNPDPPPILVVEEIENGLDPATIHLLVDEIQNAVESERIQVILTTHSPYLLDLLPLSSIVLVERLDGEPTFRRPGDEKEVKKWAKQFSPGQLYTANRLSKKERP